MEGTVSPDRSNWKKETSEEEGRKKRKRSDLCVTRLLLF